LWYNESYFYSKNLNKEIIVFCEPELPLNMEINEDNELNINLKINPQQLLLLLKEEKNNFTFHIGEKVFEIPIDALVFSKYQLYRIKGQGLTIINEKDIYDINNKSDIIVHVELNLDLV
jgi:hypothetical protein